MRGPFICNLTAQSHITVTAEERSGGRWPSLGITVRGALQAVEYGAQSLIASGLILLDAFGSASEFGHLAGEAGAAFNGQDAPGEDTVSFFQVSLFRGRAIVEIAPATLDQVFEGGVENLGGSEGQAQVYCRFIGRWDINQGSSGSFRGRCGLG